MSHASIVARKLSRLAHMGLERVEDAPVTTDSVRISRRLFGVTSGRPAMGTYTTVKTLCRSALEGQEAIGRSFEEMDRLIGLFSRFDGASAVSVLNREGSLPGAPPEIHHVVARALDYHTITGGAFDVTVQPLVELFQDRLGGYGSRDPSEGEIREVMGRIGSRHIDVSRNSIRFAKDGMGVTFDGIAKGFIVDRIAASLERHGIRDYLINAGGDVRASGTKENGRPWTVAIQDPEKRGAFPDILHLKDSAVATSGSYEIYFDPERAHHHIVDRETGRSPQLNVSVTVIAPTAMAADALATAVFVMEPGRGIAFVDSLSRCAGLIIDRHGSELRSSGWRGMSKIRKEGAGPDEQTFVA